MKLEGNLNVTWELSVYSDAEYVGDNGTRKSVNETLF